jgi:hypothetical protein
MLYHLSSKGHLAASERSNKLVHPGRNSVVGTRFPASAARAKQYAPPVFFTECTNDAISSPQVLCACGETAQIPSKYLLDMAPSWKTPLKDMRPGLPGRPRAGRRCPMNMPEHLECSDESLSRMYRSIVVHTLFESYLALAQFRRRMSL